MPSQETIEIDDGHSVKPSHSSPVEGGQSNASTSAAAQPKEITPLTENVPPKKKGKKQASLSSFFGTPKNTTTPSAVSKENHSTKATSANKSESKKPPASDEEKKPAAKLTTKTTAAASPSAASTASSTASSKTKMDFKDAIVGKFHPRKSSEKKTPKPPTDAAKNNSKNDTVVSDAMLPTIPPLSSVHSQKRASVSKPPPSTGTSTSQKSTQEMELSLSQDTSDGYGALRSQLVQKFEHQTSPEAKDHSVDNAEKMAGSGDSVGDSDKNETDEATTGEENHVVEINDDDDDETLPNPEVVEIHDSGDDDDAAKENKEETATETNSEATNKMEAKSTVAKANDTPQKAKATTTQENKPPAKIDLMSPKKEKLDATAQALVTKQEGMMIKYCTQASELVAKGRDGLEDESITIPLPSSENITLGDVSTFPDSAVPHLVCLLEGSTLPLSELSSKVCETLKNTFTDATLSAEVVSAKIKVLATRKPYVKNPLFASGVIGPNSIGKDVDAFEDTNMDHVWRWEVTLLDLLPEDAAKEVKQARSARRKLQQRYNAIANLLRSLEEHVKLLRDSSKAPTKAKLDKAVAKISKAEEAVLKHLQEDEKARLLSQAKQEKEERQREKEEAKRQAQEEKANKAKAKEQAKAQEEVKKAQEEAKKEKVKAKQKRAFESFFKPAKKQKTQNTAPPAVAKAAAAKQETDPQPRKSGFDAEEFRACIEAQRDLQNMQPFKSLSKHARESRKRKTKLVKMRVFVSSQNHDDPFAPPAFAEERLIEVRDRNKWLQFKEDCRPPYHGTWSKKSVTKKLGKKPFSKEPCLDYDVDSEAEWEEGDDDPGEDIENDNDDDDVLEDEEGDIKKYNYNDGWMEKDEDADAETEDDPKKNPNANRKRTDAGLVPVCIVAPAFGGIPIVEAYEGDDPRLAERVEGFPAEDAYKLVSSHNGAVLTDSEELFLDAFPPALVAEDREGATQASATPPPSKEPSEEDMKAIARFVHHSTLISKSQVVEELRSTHPSATSSRAQAHRILDSIADKHRHPEGGVYWEVKNQTKSSLGLDSELKAMVLPEKASAKKESKKRKASDASDSVEPKTKKAKAQTPAAGSATKAKKKTPGVSTASANLLKAFLSKKK